MKVLMATSLLLLVLNGPAICAAPNFQERDKRVQDLEKERARLAREKDPVDRTKMQIKIADILLSFVGDAIRSGDLTQMQSHLNDYSGAIQDAHQTMMATGRDANDKPKGFKDLEIALRRQVRLLDDFGGALTFDQRGDVEKAREEASGIRDALIKVLFGVQSATSGS